MVLKVFATATATAAATIAATDLFDERLQYCDIVLRVTSSGEAN